MPKLKHHSFYLPIRGSHEDCRELYDLWRGRGIPAPGPCSWPAGGLEVNDDEVLDGAATAVATPAGTPLPVSAETALPHLAQGLCQGQCGRHDREDTHRGENINQDSGQVEDCGGN